MRKTQRSLAIFASDAKTTYGKIVRVCTRHFFRRGKFQSCVRPQKSMTVDRRRILRNFSIEQHQMAWKSEAREINRLTVTPVINLTPFQTLKVYLSTIFNVEKLNMIHVPVPGSRCTIRVTSKLFIYRYLNNWNTSKQSYLLLTFSLTTDTMTTRWVSRLFIGGAIFLVVRNHAGLIKISFSREEGFRL